MRSSTTLCTEVVDYYRKMRTFRAEDPISDEYKVGSMEDAEIWKRWPNDLAIFHRKHGAKPCHMVDFLYAPDSKTSDMHVTAGVFHSLGCFIDLGVLKCF